MIQTERHRIKKCNFHNFPEFAINYPDSLLPMATFTLKFKY